MEVSFEMKTNFFDRAAIQDRLGKAQAKALSKAAAYVQRTAKYSMRRRKKPSAPGQPPSAHTSGGASLKTILFAYDTTIEAAVVGPGKFNSSRVPRLMEKGGMRKTKLWRFKPVDEKTAKRVAKNPKLKKYVNKWRLTHERRKVRYKGLNLGYEYTTVAVRYRRRPFMRPALLISRKKFPDLFANCIKA